MAKDHGASEAGNSQGLDEKCVEKELPKSKWCKVIAGQNETRRVAML